MNEQGPIETALLARLSVSARKAPSESEVLRSLRPLFGGTADADEKLRAGLESLAARGLRSRDGMLLTEKGRKQASEALGVAAGTKATWPRLKAALVELALGRTPASGKPLSSAAVRAIALASKLGLDTKSTRPAEVLDAWVARELRMDARLTIANVRAHVLSQKLGIDSVRDPKRIGTVAVAHVLGVPRTDAAIVRDSVLREWLAGASSAPANEPEEGADLESFASDVRDIARSTDDGRFGRFKVFIGPIWNRARARSTFRTMNEGEFKAKLVDAHRAGLLRLSRADLTPAMAPDVVAASEVPYLNAVFHFVDLEGALS